ncbi:MAG: crotonase/enoyl-CoA hydratase family protein [Gammaproteobacteria bacterium]|nr:crotonase/enoyl-CoA hydratase family protein [Gammaproteobacteria bacterium]
MSVPCEKMLPFTLPTYNQLLCDYDSERYAVWHYLNSTPRPCFTPVLLKEMADVQNQVRQHRNQSHEASNSIRYLVLASATRSVFSLGGDLDLFARLINNQDHEGLRKYAHLCIDCVHGYNSHLEQSGMTTIALVQGKALGGGFEAAISCNVLVAERGTQLGFPEILFNLFPGMGAYSFLVRRLNPIQVERLLREGDQYSAEKLYEMGIVDVLAEPGEGVRAVNDYIRRHERVRNGLQAIQQLREWNSPVTRQELLRIADMWVDSAMQITSRDLRTIGRLVSAQSRLNESTQDTMQMAPERRQARDVRRSLVAV